LLESGKACFYQNELEQALADLNQAVSVAKQADSDQFLDECHYYQGLVYYQAGDYNSAIICLRQALAQAQQQENQSLRTKIQDQLKKAENKM
jgi:tetratricopeptide (TPR) repeat protein